MAGVTLERAKAAKAVAVRRFRSLDNLVGVGITRVHGHYAVKVNLSERMPPGVTLPANVNGVPLLIEITGCVRPR